ncbi:serine hydrolase domain-containing protein [Aeropyrum camini]|uniref:serine hydrolase domain-containing protein n=1 Tax=Aeropyrum camini TaxID=229980 RepID=UPI0007897B48|nr:serine hydrolase domain-containing protein [Aeropyrum camini]
MPPLPAELESFLLDKISRYRMPSLVLAAFRGGDKFYASYGYSSIEKGSPASVDTAYGIGSITKSFTALAILSLEEEGELSLDDPVGDHLGVRLEVEGEPITLEHLLTHTSGVPATAYAEALLRGFLGVRGYWKPYSRPWDAVLYLKRAIEEGWAVSRPGRRFFYLNEGYVALGIVVERSSGMSYEDYIRQLVFERLGMGGSGFIGDKLDHAATPYKPGDKLEPVPLPSGITADGGIMSTARDMLRYVESLARGEFRGFAERMEKPRVRVPWQALGGEAYGYGLIIYPDFSGGSLAGHGGSLLAYTAWMGYSTRLDSGVILLSNTTGYPLAAMGMAVLSSLARGSHLDPRPVRRSRLWRGLRVTTRGSTRASHSI